MSSRLQQTIPIIRLSVFSLLICLTGLSSLHASPSWAQSITVGPDKLLPRMCADRCPQAGEQLAVDGNGNAVSIWSEPGSTSGQGKIIVARYNSGTDTWSQPQVLDNQDYLANPLIGMDSGGNAIAIWQYFFEGQQIFRSSRFNSQSARWSAPRTVLVGGYYERLSALEVAGNGNAFLHTAGRNDAGVIYRYDAETNTWTNLANRSNSVEIAADGSGGALIANGSSYPDQYVAASRYDAATRTVARSAVLDAARDVYDPKTGEPLSKTDVRFFSATRHFNGGEMVFWERRFEDYRAGTVTRSLRTAVYNRTTGSWQHLAIPKISNSQTLSGKVDADRFGNVNAIWIQYVSGYARVVTAQYSASTGQWSAPRILSQGSYHTRDVGLDTDINGNVIATWSQRTDTGIGSSLGKTFRTKAARFSLSNRTWGMPLTIQDAGRNSYRPHMGVSRSGQAIVLWQQDTEAVNGDGTPVKELRADRLLPQR